MLAWIFGIALGVVLLAGFFIVSRMGENIDGWMQSYLEQRFQRCILEDKLLGALLAHCHGDFKRRRLCAALDIEADGESFRASFLAAPSGAEGKDWSFGASLNIARDGTRALFIHIEACLRGVPTELRMRLDGNHPQYMNAWHFLDLAKKHRSKTLSHEEAAMFVRLFFRPESESARGARMHFSCREQSPRPGTADS